MSAGRSVISKSQSWGTPKKYVDVVRAFFGGSIDLDPCSNEFSVVGAQREYRLPEHDGLAESWDYRRIYVNPPYGTDWTRGTKIKQWLAKCAEAHEKFGSEVLALIPIASNTSHWKQHIWGRASAIAFLYDTRLRFLVDGKDSGKGAPMACCMVYWGARFDDFWRSMNPHGAVVDIRHLIGISIGN